MRFFASLRMTMADIRKAVGEPLLAILNQLGPLTLKNADFLTLLNTIVYRLGKKCA